MASTGPGATAISIVVPDASVLLKWVLPGDDEPGAGSAMELLDEARAGAIKLVVPQLWLYEVGNTLVRRFPCQANELLACLVDFQLTEAQVDARWRNQTVYLAVSYGVTFYDAAYHAVALIRGGIFVTADERYVRRASNGGNVVLLRHWNSL